MYSSSTTTLLYSTLLLSSPKQLLLFLLLLLLPYYYCLLLLIVWSAYQVRKILSIWCSYIVMLLFLGSSTCFFFAKSPLSSICCHLSYPLCFGSSTCYFLPNLPSPLLSFVLPMMKLFKSIHYMEYKLMIKNLWGTWHHYQPPLQYLILSSLLCCLDAPKYEASTTSTTCFLGYIVI